MRAMYHMAAFVAEGVPVFDIRAAAGVTDLLVKDARLGRSLAASLGSKPAALMRGHGAVVVAGSLPNVVGRGIYLDVNARAQMQAIALGGKISYVDAGRGPSPDGGSEPVRTCVGPVEAEGDVSLITET